MDSSCARGNSQQMHNIANKFVRDPVLPWGASDDGIAPPLGFLAPKRGCLCRPGQRVPPHPLGSCKCHRCTGDENAVFSFSFFQIRVHRTQPVRRAAGFAQPRSPRAPLHFSGSLAPTDPASPPFPRFYPAATPRLLRPAPIRSPAVESLRCDGRDERTSVARGGLVRQEPTTTRWLPPPACRPTTRAIGPSAGGRPGRPQRVDRRGPSAMHARRRLPRRPQGRHAIPNLAAAKMPARSSPGGDQARASFLPAVAPRRWTRGSTERGNGPREGEIPTSSSFRASKPGWSRYRQQPRSCPRSPTAPGNIRSRVAAPAPAAAPRPSPPRTCAAGPSVAVSPRPERRNVLTGATRR